MKKTEIKDKIKFNALRKISVRINGEIRHKVEECITFKVDDVVYRAISVKIKNELRLIEKDES